MESEHNEVDGMKKGVDSKGEVIFSGDFEYNIIMISYTEYLKKKKSIKKKKKMQLTINMSINYQSTR